MKKVEGYWAVMCQTEEDLIRIKQFLLGINLYPMHPGFIASTNMGDYDYVDFSWQEGDDQPFPQVARAGYNYVRQRVKDRIIFNNIEEFIEAHFNEKD